MRIAIVSGNLIFPWGGNEKPWTFAAELARQSGDALLLVVNPVVAAHPRIQALVAAGACLHRRTRFSHPTSWGQRARDCLDRSARWSSLESALRRFKPDCLLLNQGGMFDFLLEDRLFEWCGRRHVPIVLYCNCNSEAWSLSAPDRARARQMLRNVAATIFSSTHNLRMAERQLAAPLPHAGVLQSPLDNGLLRAPPAWPEGPGIEAAVVARLDAHHKGLDLLIPALHEAWGSHAEWLVNFHGEGPDRGYLEELAAVHGLRERIRFHGFTRDIRAVWEQNQLLLMPSRHEGCSHSMLEALACGRPVLATDVGGVSDWLQDGVNGFVCPAPTRALVAQTLARAWEDRARWREMGDQAARLFRAQREPAPEKAILDVLRQSAAGDRVVSA